MYRERREERHGSTMNVTKPALAAAIAAGAIGLAAAAGAGDALASTGSTSGAANDLKSFFTGIQRLLFTLGVPIATIGVMIGGILYMFSQGNPSAMERGKMAIQGSLMGLAVVVAAGILVNFISDIAPSSPGAELRDRHEYGAPPPDAPGAPAAQPGRAPDGP